MTPRDGTVRFADRAVDGRELAAALAAWRGRHPLVLAIPRGGVPLGRAVADALGGDLDVVLVRKLGAPRNPELAIGAVDESGRVQLAAHAARTGADATCVRAEAARQLEVIRARRAAVGAGPPIAGRPVVVVDDGLATGLTMQAALVAVRAAGPAELLCAVPVASADSLQAVRALADRVVCLAVPREFYAVGQFYEDFRAVEDADVLRLLGRDPVAAPLPMLAPVRVPAGEVELCGDLALPAARGLVLFVHVSGSSRHSPRNRFVAASLQRVGLATLLIDLLTQAEDADERRRFDIPLLATRVAAVLDWVADVAALRDLPLGLFGASTGAAAALIAAAQRPRVVAAVVSRGGRPDLAPATVLARVRAPTLLVVGAADTQVLALNRTVLAKLRPGARLQCVPDATHLFEEPGALERVAELAATWFDRHLGAAEPPA